MPGQHQAENRCSATNKRSITCLPFVVLQRCTSTPERVDDCPAPACWSLWKIDRLVPVAVVTVGEVFVFVGGLLVAVLVLVTLLGAGSCAD